MDEGKKPSAQEQPAEREAAPRPSGKPASKRQRKLRLVVGVLLLLVIGGGSFILGSRRARPEEVSEAGLATESAQPEEPEVATPSPTRAPEAGITPTPTPSPTPKPSPTPTPTPTPQTITFNSSSTIDGFRSSNAGGNSTLEIRAGRNVNLITRGFVSFGTASIPGGATIQKATLRLYQVKIIGDPYGAGIRVMVDHLDYGDSLEHADYGAAAISASFATLSENATLGWKEVDVTDAVRNDRSTGRERSQFRIHMTTENQGGTVQGDFAYFESADNNQGSGNTPQLLVTYNQ